MEFKCDCGEHILEISCNTFPFEDICIAIYTKYSPKGKEYKKPKLVSDVVISNNAYPKELRKLLKYFKKIIEKLI